MAKCNINFHFLLHLTLFLQIMIPQITRLQAATLEYNSSGSRPRCVEAERKALLQIRNNNTNVFHPYSSWVGEDCCGWTGVGCSNRTGNVVKLDLGTGYSYDAPWFRGKLSPSLLELNQLIYLNLSGNDLVGMIPPYLGNLSNLHYLDLSYNRLWASDLNWLSGLTSLEYLNLGGVNLSKASTSWLEAISLLPTLSELHLFDCNLENPPLSLSIANHTSLSIIDLSHNKLISEITPLFFNITTLVELDLFYCNITGPISYLPWHNLHNLEVLNLGDNSISGSIPISVGNLSSLIHLDLSYNYWNGKLSEVHIQKLSKLKYLGISSTNKALVFDVARDWIPPFSLQAISIIDCLLGPTFPPWIQTQKELTDIVLSNVNISDTIPDWFWTLPNPQINSIDLSSNEIRGELLYSLQFNSLVYVNLSHNHLHGSIPLWSNVSILSLRNNSFSGPIPMEIGTIMSTLEYLDLSLNSLNGTIPKSIGKMENLLILDLSQNNLSGQMFDKWDSRTGLEYIDLSKNDLFGEIPMSICSSPFLFWLDLSDNSFNGGLPLSLQNCTTLDGLNLGGNRLSGNVPRWSGKSLPSIGVISLRMNKLVGEIPQEICSLPKLHALDLSHNNLSGTIPACFGNLSDLMVSAEVDTNLNNWMGVMDFVVKGRLLEFVRILYLVNILDLSNNNFTGEIPKEIANLIALGTLNFSKNQLNGEIPKRIGELRQLETLDLSHNHLSGPIPASMASLTLLSALDLSFNNLSGSIPSSTQLSTFNSSIYEDNPGLCGPPLSNPCYNPVTGDFDKDKNKKRKVRNKDNNEMFWFYVSMGPGFVVGFWGLFGSLAIKRTWRIAYFKYFDSVTDRLFVFVAVKINLLKRMMKRGEK